MLRNYILTTLRILSRQKVYSAINIFGLTIGITSTLLLILYIVDEISYDRFHTDADRMYRSVMSAKLNDQEFSTIYTGLPMPEALLKDVPAVESVIRVAKWNTIPVRFDDKTFTENRFLLSDSNFFNFFSFQLLVGNPKEVLNGPNKVVITESTAKKYFGYTGPGDLSPIGKMFFIGSQGETKAEVTGIAADVPHNSHLKFDFLLSITTWEQLNYPIWLNSAVVSYFKIRPNTTIEDVDNKYDFFVNTYIAKEIEMFLQMTMQQLAESGSYIRFSSQPLTSIHLHSQLSDELEPNGNIRYLYLFGMIAIFLIVLACINFMNLSTARAANRAKEVGIRKTIGALRHKLIGQFMMESYLYTIIAILLALMLVSFSLNFFNSITAKNIAFTSLLSPMFLGGLFVFTIVIGALAGSYPAFYLTAFKPAEVLKGKVRAGFKSSGIRNALVVFQFFISIGLIIATLMVFQQLKFVQQQNLGFDKRNIMTLLHTLNLAKNGEAFKNELKQYPEIESVTFANRMPPNVDWNSVFRIPDTGQEQMLTVYTIDYDGLETMGYQLAEGRFFSRDFKTDTATCLINEAAFRQLGWDTYEGKKILSRFNTMEGNELEVIGIIKNFNYESLKSNIRPMIIMLGPEPNFEAGIRFASDDIQRNIKLVEEVWKKYAPQAPLEYSFLDSNFAAKYKAEERMGQVFIIFTGLAIIIACLGLLGLATYSAEQRAKEISIRKVMGATVSQVVFLLSKDFAKLIVVAFVLAIPLTWYLLERYWLEGFAYRIHFNPWIIASAGLVALVVALLTISIQAFRAAMGNPVDSLRGE
ncbi:MAG: ABC transporter permease [Cyclobacteriaceae bacterium]|nr:ABC transporter permease [Cyclobacteriaceae bacterium]UYN86165.1 MAG: ABC transporter permease [Cyclobacteriaceae bacterium]